MLAYTIKHRHRIGKPSYIANGAILYTEQPFTSQLVLIMSLLHCSPCNMMIIIFHISMFHSREIKRSRNWRNLHNTIVRIECDIPAYAVTVCYKTLYKHIRGVHEHEAINHFGLRCIFTFNHKQSVSARTRIVNVFKAKLETGILRIFCFISAIDYSNSFTSNWD